MLAAPTADTPVHQIPPDLSRDADIKVTPAPFPAGTKDEVDSADGHKCAVVLKYSLVHHANDVAAFVHSPGGKDLKIDFKPVYWTVTNVQWVDKNLLKLRVWWSRRWGVDYVINADTGDIFARQGFEETRGKPAPAATP